MEESPTERTTNHGSSSLANRSFLTLPRQTLMNRLYAPLSLLFAALLLLAGAAPRLHAQNVDNRGKEFIMSFLPNDFSFRGTQPVTEIHLTGSSITTVTVEYPVNAPSFSETVDINPGEITIVEIPNASSLNWDIGSVDNNAVRAFSDDEFVVYMINRRPVISDAALALPKDALNTQYLVSTYQASEIQQDRGEFGVVAAFDNTTVEITPTKGLQGGYPAGIPFTIMLNKGEGFLGQSTTNGTGGDLTGTFIEASRPVSVSNGNLCGTVPPATNYCDHLFEFAHPLQTWGRTIPVMNLPNRTEGSVYRVVAAEDDTAVLLDGTIVATLDKGEFYESGILEGAHLFSSDSKDKPVFVYQFMTGSTRPGTGGIGDPAMGNMIPSDQYLEGYTFSTVGGGQFANHFLTIIASSADVSDGTILLDGAPVAASEFTAIPGTDLSATTIELTEGTHTTSSSNASHGITVEGYNDDDSYLYPGGARFQFINPVADDAPPVCEGNLNGTRETFTGSVRDEADEDDTGVFFVVLDDESENLMLEVEDFTPGDSPVGYTVTKEEPAEDASGFVVGTDGSGNQCTREVIIPASGAYPVINEFLADPAGATDTNGDGTADDAEDEFVELFNGTDETISMAGYILSDADSNTYVFPGDVGIEPDQGVTIYGGGTPTGISGFTAVGLPVLDDDGDRITLTNAGGLVVDVIRYDEDEASEVTLARNVNGEGPFELQNTFGPMTSHTAGFNNNDGTPLPVELAAFTATSDGEDVLLRWQTASETGNAGFEVQHQPHAGTGGFLAEGAWQRIAFLSSQAPGGTSAEALRYSYRAEGLGAGRHAFRLRQVDLDGTESFSGVREVEIALAEAFVLSEATPNPARGGRATLTLTVRETQDVRAEVYDMLGRRVAVLHDGPLSAGVPHTLTLEASRFASGLYLVRVAGERFAPQMRRVVVAK